MKTIQHFSTILPQYDSFILDLWGVVHDGTAMYPGAKECMQQMQAAGKQVVILSNAPRRAAKAQVVLDALGVGRDLYQGIYTSGEVAYQQLGQGKLDLGRRYLFIGPQRDADVLDGLGLERVFALDQADFLLNVGFGSEQDETANVSELLGNAQQKNIPMLCLNPDLHVVKITGERFECAGVIAADYKAIGGVVHYYGKPYSAVYDVVHAALGHAEKRSILAIGDGPDTDIRGAVSFGVDSLLITGGIMKHGEAFEFYSENSPVYCADMWRW